jgi:restriction system protein
MDIFGDTDIVGIWLQLLFSPFGLLLLAFVVARVAFDRLLQPRRRGPTQRWRSGSRWPRSIAKEPAARAALDREQELPRLTATGSTLEEIRRVSPGGFEHFVADLFHRRGYAVLVVGGDGDHGVDLVVTNPGGERELVQCKRWGRKWIGEPVVRDFYGALMHDGRAVRSYIVTTSFFSHAARAWARNKPIKLIDGKELSWAAERIIALGRNAEKAPSSAAPSPR